MTDVAMDPAFEAAVDAGLAATTRLIGTLRTERAGMAYIVGAVDSARALADWVPWWLEPRLAAVRALHRPFGSLDCATCRVPMPCPTVQALAG